jgi:hypothetical protein
MVSDAAETVVQIIDRISMKLHLGRSFPQQTSSIRAIIR